MRISCVLLYSLFFSPKFVSAVRLYGDETDIRRLCAFLSVLLHETQKRQTENRTNNKTFNKGRVKTLTEKGGVKLYFPSNSLKPLEKQPQLWYYNM